MMVGKIWKYIAVFIIVSAKTGSAHAAYVGCAFPWQHPPGKESEIGLLNHSSAQNMQVVGVSMEKFCSGYQDENFDESYVSLSYERVLTPGFSKSAFYYTLGMTDRKLKGIYIEFSLDMGDWFQWFNGLTANVAKEPIDYRFVLGYTYRISHVRIKLYYQISDLHGVLVTDGRYPGYGMMLNYIF